MSELKNYIESMSNPELIGLAKNRFLDEEDQLAIAKHHYKRAHMYLTENQGLKPKAREALWNSKGYVNKCQLISYGHYKNEPEKYEELYRDYGSRIRSRSPWRMTNIFLRNNRYWAHGGWEQAYPETPASILEDIYEKDVVRPRHPDTCADTRWQYGYSSEYVERALIDCPNTPLDIIVKISASSPKEMNRNLALKQLANRS